MSDLEFSAAAPLDFSNDLLGQKSAHSWSIQDWRGDFRAEFGSLQNALPFSQSGLLAAARSAFGAGPSQIAGVLSHNPFGGLDFAHPQSSTQSGFTINVTFDSSVSSAPAGFTTAVNAAVAYLESQFSDPISLNIHIGYGEVNGSPMSAGALGQSSSFLIGVSYADLKAALAADGTTADDATALASLTASDPTGGGNYFITIAEARSLGLWAASDTQIDGYAGFSSTDSFDYDNSNGVSGGSFDFYDVVLHELTELMGRQLVTGGSIGSTTNSYEPLDLFHYSASGVRDFSATTAGYFSIDGGVTHLKDFNIDPDGDAGDWASSAGNDACLAFSGPGVINGFSEADLKAMDIIGFNRVTGGASSPDLTAGSVSLNVSTLSFQIHNAGTATAGTSTTGLYLSADSTITTGDTLLTTHATPSLASGASDNENSVLVLPTNLTPGTYYLGVVADYNATISESDETNNASTGVPVILGNDNINTLNSTSGVDHIFAFGNNDTIAMGANLTVADQLDGGAGSDTVTLNGNYSAGVTLGATTMLNVEHLILSAGNNYNLTTNNATVAAGQLLYVDASALAAANGLTFNGAAETDGQFSLTGGAGNDVATGGNLNDVFHMENGGNDTVSGGSGNDLIYFGGALTAADAVNGGAGTDWLYLNGNYSGGLTFGATTLTNIEHIVLSAGNNYNLTINNATVAAAQLLFVDASSLAAANTLTFNGAAESDGALSITGGAGNDNLTGSGGSDFFHLEHGGNDTVSGGNGNDQMYFAGALTAADTVNGGAGTDYVYLNGNYAGGLTFGATTMTNVEQLILSAGNNYNLTTSNATVAAAQLLFVDASTLAAANTLTFNGAAETDGRFSLTGGAGNDTLTGGSGSDVFHMENGGNDTVSGGNGNDLIYFGGALTAADAVNGGAGTDYVYLNGNYVGGLTFGASTLVGVEHVVLSAGNNYNLTTNDATVAAGQTLYVDASLLGSGNTLTFNAAAELDGQLSLTGGAGNDVATGGNLIDTFHMENGGTDTVSGGNGNDLIYFGGALTAADAVNGGAGTDWLYLNGNYSGGLTFGATTLTNIEHIVLSAGNNYNLTINNATVAAAQLLFVDASSLAAANTLTFNGAAESDGALSITGGAGNDNLTGSGGSDFFHLEHGGNDTVSGGNGNDQMYFAGALTAADTVNGGAGTDYVYLNGNYAGGLTFGATTMTNVEQLILSAGNNYNLTTSNATVAAAQLLFVDASTLAAANTLTFNGAAETDGRFSLTGGAGNDTLTGGSGSDLLTGKAGADLITGNGGADHFIYGAVSESTSVTYDTLAGVDFASDRFDLTSAVTGIDTAAPPATLSTASFDTDLANATNGHLLAHHAELFTANAGTLSGQTFLIVDVNGTAGYQANADLVFHLTGQTGTLATTDFI